MNGGSTGPLSATGEKIFAELGCSTCHRTDTQGRGPNLQGVFGKPVQLEDGRTVTADENYLRECILDPGAKRVKGFQPIMPTFQGLVTRRTGECPGRLHQVDFGGQAGEGAKTSASAAAPPTAASANGSQVQ